MGVARCLADNQSVRQGQVLAMGRGVCKLWVEGVGSGKNVMFILLRVSDLTSIIIIHRCLGIDIST